MDKEKLNYLIMDYIYTKNKKFVLCMELMKDNLEIFLKKLLKNTEL